MGYSATILAGQTYVNVPHGLGFTPSITDIYVTPAGDLEGRSFWPDTPTATTFRINMDSMDTKDHVFTAFYNSGEPPAPPPSGEVTIDSFGLKCQSLQDDALLIASDFDEWSGGQVMKTRKVYGAKGVWKLNLFEHDAVWAASAAKYLQDKAKSGGTVVLSVDEGARFTLDATTCYVLGCQTSLGLKGKVNVHYFTATFREV